MVNTAPVVQPPAPIVEPVVKQEEPVAKTTTETVPPRPNAEMLAAAAAMVTGAPYMSPEQLAAVQAFEAPEHEAAITPAMLSSQMGTGAEGGELARARAIAQRLGITNLTADEYDIPTYIRRQQEKDL